jgi:hypothetical protein
MEMMTAFSQLGWFSGLLEPWQLGCLLVLIGLIVFLIWYRKRQM